MKKRVLMSSVAASVLAGMFMLSGCGSSSSTVADVIDSSNPTNTATPIASKPDSKTDDKTDNKPALDTRSCSVLKYVGSVSGVKVEAYDEAGDLIAVVTTDAKGEYCFSQKPAQVKVASESGKDDKMGSVTCVSKIVDFDEEMTNCVNITGFDADSSPLHSLNRAKQFRSFMGDVYEKMDIDFDVYDKAIRDSLTLSSIVEIEDKLLAVKVKTDKEGHADHNLSDGQKNIIKNIIELATSNSNDDVVSLAMFTFNEKAARVKATETNATLKALYNGDDKITEWINENRIILERYILANTPEDEKSRVYKAKPEGINLKIFANFIIDKIVELKAINFSGDSKDIVADLEKLGNKIPAASLGEHFLETEYIACGPVAQAITVSGDYNNTGLEFTNISSVHCECDTSVDKDHVDGNTSKAVTQFKMWTKGIFFNEKGLAKEFTRDKQYEHIIDSVEDLFNVKVALDINTTGIVSEKELLATIVLDVPNACDSEDGSKDEYMAVTFKLNASVPTSDKNMIFTLPDNSEIVFSSKMKHKDDKNVTTYPKELYTVTNVVSNELLRVENGVMKLDFMDLLDQAMAKANTANATAAAKIRDLLVRAVSNVDGDPTMTKTSISLIDMNSGKNFIANASTIDPSAYRLDLSGVDAYDKIFDDMRKSDTAVKAIAVKTCFGGRDEK